MSGRAILQALIAGETDPSAWRPWPAAQLKASPAELRAALHGRITAITASCSSCTWTRSTPSRRALREVEARVGKALAPFARPLDHLTTMPGVSETVAHVIVAEIGVDMTRFPDRRPSGLLGRALCPARRERRQAPLHPRAQGRPLAQDHPRARPPGPPSARLPARPIPAPQGRRGPKKAILAVAASMLTAAYYMLRDGVDYRDLGADHFARRDKTKLAKRLVARLHDLGFTVELKAA